MLSTLYTYRPLLQKLIGNLLLSSFFFHSLPLHERLFSDYVKKRTVKVFKKKTFALSLYALLQYYRYTVNRWVICGVCGCLNNVQGNGKPVVAFGSRQSSSVRDDHSTFYLFFNMLQKSRNRSAVYRSGLRIRTDGQQKKFAKLSGGLLPCTARNSTFWHMTP